MLKVKKDKNKPVVEENKYLNYLLLILFSVLICFFTTYKISTDNDLFWHLATGRFIVQNHFIPTTDVFGFLSFGQHWIPFEWGWEVLNYFIFLLGGYVALSLMRTAIILAVFYLFYLILKKNKVDLSLSVIFGIIILLGLLTRLTIRPQIVTYLFIVLVLYILLNYRSKETPGKSILIYLPLSFMIWANLHMGVIFGVAIFGIFVFSESIKFYYIDKDTTNPVKRKKLVFLLLSFTLSLLALAVNPFFIHVYLYTFSYTKINMLEQISEWKSPLRAETLSYYNGKIYLFFLVSGIMLFYYSYKKKDYLPSMLYVFVGIYSMQAVRFMADFFLTVFAFWMIAFNMFVDKIRVEKFLKSNLLKGFLAFVLIYIIYLSYDSSFYKNYLGNYFRESGFGINENYYPVTMFDFMKKEGVDKIGERPFNNLKIGGYFSWEFPGVKNFIDSRDLYDDLYANYKIIDLKKPGFEALIDKYNLDYFIYSTPYLTVNAGEIRNNIVSYLTVNPDKWKLIYWDDKSFLFVKNLPKFEKLISQYEYKYISPYNFVFNRDAMTAKYQSEKVNFLNEIKRKQNEEPNGIFINDMAKFYNR